MNPAVASSLIQGGSGLVSSAFGNKGNNRALKAQSAATDRGLAFQMSESAKEEARYKQNRAEQALAWNDYNRTMEPSRRRRAELLGIKYVAPSSVAPEGWTPPVQQSTLGSMATGGGPQSIQGGNVAAPLQAPTLGTIAGAQFGRRNPFLQQAQTPWGR